MASCNRRKRGRGRGEERGGGGGGEERGEKRERGGRKLAARVPFALDFSVFCCLQNVVFFPLFLCYFL